ncbi:hypothetical protein SLA2020_435320 [Shorea laevis]
MEEESSGMEIDSHIFAFSALASLLTVISLVVVFMVSDPNYSVTGFADSKSEFSLPTAELQRIIPSTPDHIKAISDGSTVHLHTNRSRNSTGAVIRKLKRLNREEELARARASIRMAVLARNVSAETARFEKESDLPAAQVYRNLRAFLRSYTEMERRFKVYVYMEGDIPIVHRGPCKDIYAIEGRFISEMEHGFRRFRTSDPHRAHVFFMPFSATWMVRYLYTPLSYNHRPLRQFVSDYVRVISTKYPFWNRTQGADHFMLACHDWGPSASRGSSLLYNNSIRVLCNANTSEGFKPQKDVSLPEIALYGGNISPKLLHPPPPNASRPHLSFFAGGLHGPIRPLLLQQWKGRDPDMQVYEYLPKDRDYYTYMLNSKYCLCPSGYEVASPRIVEAIYAECVPVILSEHYVLPFSDVLQWEAFSIQVETSEIFRLKEILMAVPEEKHRRLQEGLRAVRKHFMLNQHAKRFDVLHMILHSIWLRRINRRLP